MTDPSARAHHAFEHLDDAGQPDLKGGRSQDQEGLISEVADGSHGPAVDFNFVHDERSRIYEATLGETEIAGLPYNVESGRRVLLATSVVSEFRKKGVATELIRRVRDDVRTRGETITVMCPIVRAFIERNPDYGDLIDSEYPGVIRRPH